jgi:hypothetical protein
MLPVVRSEWGDPELPAARDWSAGSGLHGVQPEAEDAPMKLALLSLGLFVVVMLWVAMLWICRTTSQGVVISGGWVAAVSVGFAFMGVVIELGRRRRLIR